MTLVTQFNYFKNLQGNILLLRPQLIGEEQAQNSPLDQAVSACEQMVCCLICLSYSISSFLILRLLTFGD